MHTFQPYPIELYEANPFTLIGEQWYTITAEKDGKVNTMTANWGTLGSLWGKYVAIIYVRESRLTHEFLDACDYFSITNYHKNNRSALKYLGSVSGRDEDKIAGARFHINYDSGVPFIDEGTFSLICKKMSRTELTPDQFIDPGIEKEWYKEGDYHTMYVGEIIKALAR